MSRSVVHARTSGADRGRHRSQCWRRARDRRRLRSARLPPRPDRRGRAGLEGARREVEAVGGEALVCPADVADAHALIEAADRIAQRFGAIDVWVNNAMATVFGPFQDVTPAEFRRVTEVTYLGQVHGTMAALRHMRPRDAGTIVQVGSALAYRAIPLQAAYCGAKFAVRGFTDVLRSELLHDRSRIRLTMVQLPAVNTPQFDWSRNHLGRRAQPVPPIYQPEAVAEAIVEAVARAPRELWVGGPAVKAIVGGLAVPALADRLLAHQGYSGQITAEPLPPATTTISRRRSSATWAPTVASTRRPARGCSPSTPLGCAAPPPSGSPGWRWDSVS